MSRRRRAVRRAIAEDAKYHSVLVARLINKVMKWGQKSKPRRLFTGLLMFWLKKHPGVEPMAIVQRAIDNVKPRLEVKARRVGGATYQVPLEVPVDRQISLAIRWIVALADAHRGCPWKTHWQMKFQKLLKGQGSAIRKRDDMHRMAQANKAFAHFRW